jgi:hypothetical protein
MCECACVCQRERNYMRNGPLRVYVCACASDAHHTVPRGHCKVAGRAARTVGGWLDKHGGGVGAVFEDGRDDARPHG